MKSWSSSFYCSLPYPNIANGQDSFCLLEYYVLATYKVSRQVPTTDSVHPWRLYRASPLRDHASGIMTQYPTQSYYHDTELTSPRPILIMQSARLGSEKYQFCNSLDWLDWELNSRPSARVPLLWDAGNSGCGEYPATCWWPGWIGSRPGCCWVAVKQQYFHKF